MTPSENDIVTAILSESFIGTRTEDSLSIASVIQRSAETIEFELDKVQMRDRVRFVVRQLQQWNQLASPAHDHLVPRKLVAAVAELAATIQAGLLLGLSKGADTSSLTALAEANAVIGIAWIHLLAGDCNNLVDEVALHARLAGFTCTW